LPRNRIDKACKGFNSKIPQTRQGIRIPTKTVFKSRADGLLKMGFSGLGSSSAIEGGGPYGKLEAGIGMKSCKQAQNRDGVLSIFFLEGGIPRA
jgi:hypothetical protein